MEERMNFDTVFQYHRRTGRTTRMLEAAIEYWKSGKDVRVVARGDQVEYMHSRLRELGYQPSVEGPRISVRSAPAKFDYDAVEPSTFVDHFLFERRMYGLAASAERWNLVIEDGLCRSKFEARRKYSSHLLFMRTDSGKYSDNGIQREWELWTEAWEAATGRKV